MWHDKQTLAEHFLLNSWRRWPQSALFWWDVAFIGFIVIGAACVAGYAVVG